MYRDVVCLNFKKRNLSSDENVEIQIENMTDIIPLSLLHEKETLQYFKKNDKKKRELVCGRYFAKLLVARKLNCNYRDIFILNEEVGDMKGKPLLYINNELSEYHISISHDGGIYLAGVSKHNIGVDVIANRRIVSDLSVIKEYSNGISKRELPPCLIWGIKEALTKAIGIGMMYGINSIEICKVNFEKELISLKLSKALLKYNKFFSRGCFKYDITDKATYVVCELIK